MASAADMDGYNEAVCIVAGNLRILENIAAGNPDIGDLPFSGRHKVYQYAGGGKSRGGNIGHQTVFLNPQQFGVGCILPDEFDVFFQTEMFFRHDIGVGKAYIAVMPELVADFRDVHLVRRIPEYKTVLCTVVVDPETVLIFFDGNRLI